MMARAERCSVPGLPDSAPLAEQLEPRILMSRTLPAELLSASQPIDVSATGTLSVGGTISEPTGADVYRFIAPAKGKLEILMNDAGSGLDAQLEVFNARGRRIRRNDNASRESTDSRVAMGVQAGRTYYVAASSRSGTGGYVLEVTSTPKDDFGDTIEGARHLSLNKKGSKRAHGRIDYAGDVDVLSVASAANGTMTVSVTPRGRRSTVTGMIAVYDAAGDPVDTGAGSVTFAVLSGQVYYLQASGAAGSQGRYRLDVSTEVDGMVPPAPPEVDPPPGLTVSTETRDTPWGLQLLVIGTDGADTLTVSQTGSSVTVATGSGAIKCAGVYISIVVYGFGGNDAIRLTNMVSAASWLYGGEGNDALYEAGAGAGRLYGGPGDDLLVAVGGGGDALDGGEGTDGMWGDADDGFGLADQPECAAHCVHRIQQFYQPWTKHASSADYVSLEIAGQNLRDPAITGVAVGYSNFVDSYPLFVDGVQYDDVAQGTIGDCYYLASLASIAYSHPVFVKQTIAPLGDGTFAVRFYRNRQEVYLRVDGDLPVREDGGLVYARLGKDGELWVPLMEKAYAFFRYDQNSYASIDDGWMSTVYDAMPSMSIGFIWAYRPADSVWRFIERALAGGHAITAGSYYNASFPIVGSHAYMIHSIDETDEGRFVTIYNPWGVDGRYYDDNYDDGLLRISLAQLQDDFQALVTCSF